MKRTYFYGFDWLDEGVVDFIKRTIEKYLYLLPDWCKELNVFYTDDDDTHASTQSEVEYRRSRFRVGKSFFYHKNSDKESDILHEFCHVLLDPLSHFTCDVIANEIKNEELRSWLDNRRRELVERCVEDVKEAIIRHGFTRE